MPRSPTSRAISGTSLPPSDASRKAMKVAGMRIGGKIALTLSDSFYVGRFRAEFLDTLQHPGGHSFGHEEEALALFEAAKFRQGGGKGQKLGRRCRAARSAKGCVIVHGGQTHEVPAAPVAKVVDTTGAGNCSQAGFSHG